MAEADGGAVLICVHCHRPIHWYVAGWFHDDDNMACCVHQLWYGDGKLVTAEPKET